MFKHDNPSTNTNQFDIDKALNQNFDKIDTAVGSDRTRITALESDNTDNKEDIADIKEEQILQDSYIEELQAENERLREDLSTFPTKSESGEFITFDGVTDARFKKFVIGGNSKQETREGYNLANIIPNLITAKKSGLTVSGDNETGYITVNGTAEGQYVNLTKNGINITDILEDGENYTLWQENVVSNPNTGVYCQVNARKTDNSGTTYISSASSLGNYVSFKVNKSLYSSYVISVQTGAELETYNNYKNRFMLVKGSYNNSTIPEYEPYGATPSPEYPSEVKTVKGNVNVIVSNKNLCKLYKNGSISINGLTITIKNNSEITINGTSTAENWIEVGYRLGAGTTIQENKIITLNKEKSYNLSRTILNGNITGSYYMAFQKTKGSNSDNVTISGTKESSLMDSSDGIYRIYLWYPKGSVFNNYTIALQIEENTTPPGYTPHKHQDFTLSIQDEMLDGDTFKKIDGVWNEVHNWKKIVDDGTQSTWTQNTVYPNIFMRKLGDMISEKELFEGFKSNKFKYQGIVTSSAYAVDKTCYALTPSVGVISTQVFIYNSNISSLQELMNDFQNENLVLYYQPKSKRYIECTNEQKAILDQIEKTAHSYKGQTHIYGADEISPTFDVEAFIDLNEALNNLQSQILDN